MMAEGEEAMDSSENNQDQLSHDVHRRAHRIMKIFGQISECLEDQKVARIKEMLSQIIDLCSSKEEKPIQDLNKIYLEYLLMVEFRAGISVNLIKLSIQSFLMIEENPEILGKNVNDMFLEMILKEHPTLAIDMKLSDELIITYFRLLNEGSEPALHMRIMLVGMFGVGKTSLRRRLCHQDVSDDKSTEGIDIVTETCEVKEDGDWMISPNKDRERVFNIRLQTLINRYKRKDVPINERSDDLVYVREQTVQDQPLNIQGERINPREPERKSNFRKFSEKVDAKDLRQRTGGETPQKVIRRPTISIWDFAGQSIYYSTHHFFLNERSIYLIVLDLSKNLGDIVEEGDMFEPGSTIGNTTKFTCLEAFKFWMKSIYIYTKQKENHLPTVERPNYSPKIVLIGTHKDKISQEQLKGRTYEQYKDDYFDEAIKSFTKRPIAKLVHPKKFLVNNKTIIEDEKSEFQEMKREIYNIAKGGGIMSFLEEEIPAKFIPLERAVFHSKRDEKKIMSFEELQEVNRKIEFPSSPNDIELFLAFQHAFGNVIYFNTDVLHDTVILTPQWIINVFKVFVSHKSNKTVQEVGKWNDLKDFGILRQDLINELLEPHKDLCTLKEQIIRYMEHMDVIIKPVNFQSRPFEPNSGTEENFYIMPCKLPPIPTLEELKACYKLASGESNTPTLCMYFKECFLPPFVVHCILASFVKKMNIRTLDGKRILYNQLGSFSFPDIEERFLTLWSFDDILHIKINFIDKPGIKERTQFCISLRKNIEQLVLEIFNFHGKHVYTHENVKTLFEYRIKCPKCPEQMPCEQKNNSDYMCSILNASDLMKRKYQMIKCSSCGNSTSAKDILEDWFELSQDTKDDTKDVVKESCLIEMPEEDMLADLSEEIPKELIRRLAVELCIQEKEIERLVEDNTPKVCFNYRVLYQWKKRNECWDIMYNAIKTARINIKDEDFFRIIKGEESSDVHQTIEKYMKHIGKVSSCIEESLLPRLAECIGDEFWLLGVRLGIKDPTIQRLMVYFTNDCYKVCWEILKLWRKETGESTDLDTRLRVLIKALVKSRSDMSEVLKVLKTAH